MFKTSNQYVEYKKHISDNPGDDNKKVYNRYYQRFKYHLRKTQPTNTFYDVYRKLQQKHAQNAKYANNSDYRKKCKIRNKNKYLNTKINLI